jgi:predicted ferric reductase
MKNIKLVFGGFLLLLTALWLLADPLLTTPYQFFALRTSLVNYSGIIAIGVMSLALILAVRPVVFEPWLGGLDKMYRLHKWLGITALVFALIHWLWTQAPKWAVGFGWIERPARRGAATEQTSAIFQFFQNQRGLAEGLGEWAFYAAALLMVLALVKYFPYRYFFKTHRLLALAYLVLVFHSLVLMRFDYWSGVLAPLMAMLMAAGSVCALLILWRKVGISRRAVGLIDSVNYRPAIDVLDVGVALKGRWSGHQAGQFAFVTFADSEGAHPFTITSAWADDGRLRFVIKALGDYTKTLAATLKIGDPVKIEGPYGSFNFRGDQPTQIWIGGGIGITPFIARMQSLAKEPDGKTIVLFHSTAVLDQGAIDLLTRDAQAAKVELHVLVDARDGLLSAERICQLVPQWLQSDIWFCGPAGFGQALRRDFAARGLPAGNFHQELFELR